MRSTYLLLLLVIFVGCGEYGPRRLSEEEASLKSEIAAYLARGGDVDAIDQEEETRLHKAARNGHRAVVFDLLAARADRQRRNAAGKTPKEVAEANGHKEIARLLELPPSLLVVPSGYDASFGSGAYDCRYVSYSCNDEFPASGTIGAIETRLVELGWTPLLEDWMRLGVPSPDWEEFEEVGTNEWNLIHRKMTQWKDEAGNVVEYLFRYSHPAEGPVDRSNLWVHAFWSPAHGVKAFAAAVDEQMKAIAPWQGKPLSAWQKHRSMSRAKDLAFASWLAAIVFSAIFVGSRRGGSIVRFTLAGAVGGAVGMVATEFIFNTLYVPTDAKFLWPIEDLSGAAARGFELTLVGLIFGGTLGLILGVSAWVVRKTTRKLVAAAKFVTNQVGTRITILFQLDANTE